jgi:nucleoside-diphosphate-sugar epimerase
MRRVLIAGCGYVGAAAAKLFYDRGWDVTAWTRSGELADRQLARALNCHAVDVRDKEDVEGNSFACEVVVHCASSGGGGAAEYRRIYRDGVRNLAGAFPGARLIFTSSTSVYAQRDGAWVDETSPAEPATKTGRVLRETEEIVLEQRGIVLRLGGIYGPGRSFLLQSLQKGTAAITTPDRYVNQIHRDDAAAAISLVAHVPELVAPRIFNVVDNTPTRRGEILRWLSAQLAIPLLDSAETGRQKRGDSNKRVSNSKLRLLGWSALSPSYEEGLRESVLRAQTEFW